MSTASTTPGAPAFENGDRMTRAEFHRIYEAMPEDVKAELVGGVVFVAAPLRRRHGTIHVQLAGLFGSYRNRTPGVESGDNATILLGDEAEPQLDLYLRILPEFGGQSQTSDDDYVSGAPELVAEIAASSRAIDLHVKYEDYRRYGVGEYLVFCLEENELRWFDLRANRELHADGDAVCRVRSFPGLWIASAALFANDHDALLTTLESGLPCAEHADFVKQLAASRGPDRNEAI